LQISLQNRTTTDSTDYDDSLNPFAIDEEEEEVRWQGFSTLR